MSWTISKVLLTLLLLVMLANSIWIATIAIEEWHIGHAGWSLIGFGLCFLSVIVSALCFVLINMISKAAKRPGSIV